MMSLAALHHNGHAGNAGRTAPIIGRAAGHGFNLQAVTGTQSAILIRRRDRRFGHARILGRDHASVIENVSPRVSERGR